MILKINARDVDGRLKWKSEGTQTHITSDSVAASSSIRAVSGRSTSGGSVWVPFDAVSSSTCVSLDVVGRLKNISVGARHLTQHCESITLSILQRSPTTGKRPPESADAIVHPPILHGHTDHTPWPRDSLQSKWLCNFDPFDLEQLHLVGQAEMGFIITVAATRGGKARERQHQWAARRCLLDNAASNATLNVRSESARSRTMPQNP